MSTAKSDFLHELHSRGYVHQATDEAGMNRLARSEGLTGYIGFDCTAPSLHARQADFLGARRIDHAAGKFDRGAA